MKSAEFLSECGRAIASYPGVLIKAEWADF